MVAFPHCKINLGLQVKRQRSDGFHDIETVFYPVPLTDVLEIVPSPQSLPSMSCYGLPVPGAGADNLCMKAWALLKKDIPQLPAPHMHLLKHIPMGAGLGGGSSNGAAMLQLLNTVYHLHLSQQQLLDYALELGSDCPFFLFNQPCYATGRGEKLQPVALDLSSWKLVLANPGIHISTGWAFRQLNRTQAASTTPLLLQAITEPVNTWKTVLENDFEKPVFEHYPAIGALKEDLYRMGAAYASMSGSGSTVFGLFTEYTALPANLPTGFRVIHL